MKSADIIEIPIAAIQPDPENLRKVFNAEDLQALAENLKEHGQLDPVQVFAKGDGTYDLWDGERRWRASKILGVTCLKCIVVPRPSPVDLLCRKISRSMQTRALNKPEEVRALEEGLRALGILGNPENWPQAAKKLGVTASLLRERMRIANLTPNLRKEFDEGRLDYSVSQALGKLESPELQENIANFVVKENLSNRFAVLQFIPTVAEQPKRSLLESYDIAKSSEKYRYAVPRKKEDVPPKIEDRIDEMLEDFRRCLRWMEAAGRQDLIAFLTPTNFNTRRVLATFEHLFRMIGAFISAYETRYPRPEDQDARMRRSKRLTGASRLLGDVMDSKEKARPKAD